MRASRDSRYMAVPAFGRLTSPDQRPECTAIESATSHPAGHSKSPRTCRSVARRANAIACRAEDREDGAPRDELENRALVCLYGRGCYRVVVSGQCRARLVTNSAGLRVALPARSGQHERARTGFRGLDVAGSRGVERCPQPGRGQLKQALLDVQALQPVLAEVDEGNTRKLCVLDDSGGRVG